MKTSMVIVVCLLLVYLIHEAIYKEDKPANISKPPPFPEVDLNRAYDPLVKQQFKERLEYISLIQKTDAKNPQLAWAYGQLCRLFHAYQQMDDARDCYLNVLYRDSSQAEWPYLLAHVYLNTGLTDLAIEYFSQSQALNNTTTVQYWLAHSYHINQQLDQAESRYQEVLNREPNHGMSLYGLAKIRQQQKEPKAAMILLKRLLKEQPHAHQANYLLGQLYRQVGDIQSAQFHLNSVPEDVYSRISVHLEDPLMQQVADLRLSAQIQIRLGKKALAQKKYGMAVHYFEKAVTANPSRTDAQHHLALTLFLVGRFERAQEQLSQLLQIDPEHIGALELQLRIQNRMNSNLKTEPLRPE